MKHFIRRIIAVSAALLLLSGACAESWSAAVLGNGAVLYSNSSMTAKLTTLPKYSVLTVESVSGNVAKVRTGSLTAYTDVSSVTAVSDFATPAQINASTKTYEEPSTSSKGTKVSKGLRVYILGTKGSWSMIENSGNTAYIPSKYLTKVEKDAFGATPADNTPFGADDAYINTATKVYKKASTSSQSLKVAKNTAVKLVSVSGTWARVWKDGVYAYIPSKYITKGTVPESATSVTSTTDLAFLSSSKYSNEQKCYLFLTKVTGLNTAAACGLLANFYRESSFNPTCGSSYYGLAQWSSSHQKDLRSYCSKYGYSASSIEGQLRFLKYHMQTSYPDVWTKLATTPNTAQGAYDAAYYFCYYYERPKSKSSSSVTRGNLAKNTYYPKYR